MIVANIFVCLLGALTVINAATRMDYEVDRENENLIFLECLGSGGRASAEAQFEFFEPTGVLRGSSRPDEGNRRRFEVTPQNEAIIGCKIGNESPSQNNISIAAIPRSYEDDPPIVVNVLSGMPAHMMCPIPLGLLHTTLNPYYIFWVESTEFPVPVKSGSFSPDNTTLTVTVTERSTFQCSLKLARCANSARCPLRNHHGPEHQIHVYEPAEIVGSLADAVTFGDTAQVTCSGSGSYITVNWTVTINNAMMCNSNNCDSNVIIMCNNQSCNPNFLEYSENLEIIDSDIQNHRIFSTLFIDTSQFNASLLRGGQEVLDINVECSVEQAFPPNLLLSGRNPFFFTTVRVNSPPIVSTTTDTTTSDSSPMTTTATVNSGEETGRVDSSLVAAIVTPSVLTFAALIVVVLVLAIILLRRKKRKYSIPPSDSPDLVEAPPIVKNRPSRIYEELPESKFIVGVESQQSLLRQNAIEYDPANPKADNFSCHGSDDYHSRSGCGSDLSGLSGVSGNAPGAHRMPTYSHDASVVSENYLVPPTSWEARRYSDGSRQTQSTIVPSTYHPEFHRHSATEVAHNVQPPYSFPQRPNSYNSINYNTVNVNESLFLLNGREHQDTSYGGPSPCHGCASHHSSSSSCRKRLDSFTSRASSSHSHGSQHNITDTMLLTVVNCLMHNRDCEIPACPCLQIKERYFHLQASSVQLQQMHSPEQRSQVTNTLTSSSSNESDSEPNNSRVDRSGLRLQLRKHDAKKLHPHYHISRRSHIRKTRSSHQESHRRSRSLSDLTPITESRETPLATPKVGGAIVAGTPICQDRCLGDSSESEKVSLAGPTREELLSEKQLTPLSKPFPPLLKEISISSDNLPVLCLNDCLLQLRTPSPNKCHGHSLAKGKPRRSSSKLKTVRENSNGTETDDSNTSSRSSSSLEATKSSQSDAEGPVEDMHASPSSYAYSRSSTKSSSGLEGDIRSSQKSSITYSKVESSGYESLEGESSVANSHTSKQYRSSSPFDHRSSSPFETATTVSHDGAVIQTTEC